METSRPGRAACSCPGRSAGRYRPGRGAAPAARGCPVRACRLGLLALIGLALATAQYLDGQPRPDRARSPAAHRRSARCCRSRSRYRRPLLAWRLAYSAAVPRRDQRGDRASPGRGTRCRSSASWSCWPSLALRRGPRGHRLGRRADQLVPVFLFAEQANACGVAVLLVGDRRWLGDHGSPAPPQPAGAGRAGRAQRAGTGPARGAGGAHPDRPGDARRGGAPHVDDRGAGGDRAVPADRPAEPAREEFATIAAAARDGADRHAAAARRAAQRDRRARRAAPQPGLADAGRAGARPPRRAGVAGRRSPRPRPRDGAAEAVGLAAYRIVQEALANAARHAPGAPVTRHRSAARRTRLELTGRQRASPHRAGRRRRRGAGHGLVGMRERAALLGGTLERRADAPTAGSASLAATLPPRPTGRSLT